MKVLIAGSGKMGTDLVYYLNNFGLELVWLCVDENEADRAREQFFKKASRRLRTGLIDQKEFDDLQNRVVISSDINAGATCNFVIEAIWEDESLKKALFEKLDKVLPLDAIITSNTSSVPLNNLIINPIRMPCFCGLHFFYPCGLRNIVEINATHDFSAYSLKLITTFLDSIERKYILLSPKENFLLNRLLLSMQLKACQLLSEENIPIKVIDAWVRKNLLPIGIFEFFDHVGIDVMLASVNNYFKNQPDGNDYTVLIKTLEDNYIKGNLGIKSGCGFYNYPINHEIFNISEEDNNSAEMIVNMLEKEFYLSIKQCLKSQFIEAEELDYAIMEYWGVEDSFLDKGKAKGYFA